MYLSILLVQDRLILAGLVWKVKSFVGSEKEEPYVGAGNDR